MTYEELQNIENPESYPFTRTKTVQEAYERKLKLLGMAGITPSNYILSRWVGDECYMCVENEFPYDFEDCTHMIMWWRDTDSTKMFDDACALLEDGSRIMFKNETKKQSVQNLTHYHVIVPNEITIKN